ncbi:hypothetical protein M413DRAFT_66425 [Hebeloma cylindrosporum]|uniref:F-box domain-containing protein n=1 Tax=Hebeloma cylindrosporum TaxID=76867 RepID=A0A0C3C8R3_HEBCY|nr:hypothetical protein M413DRAFT_66425 [Hebeloma cylindrosporum h7]
MSALSNPLEGACHESYHSHHVSFSDNQLPDAGRVISPRRGACGLGTWFDGNFSPTFLLPIEILQDIFIRCLPHIHRPPSSQNQPLSHFLDRQAYTPTSAPLLLCQICELWRQCAISLPDLWASLGVYVSWGDPRPSLGLAELWLARSGALPLSLGLYQQNELNENRVSAAEVLDIYTRYIHRWSNIQFDLSGPRYNRLLTSQQRSAPMLKYFRMQTSCRVYEDDEKDLFGIFNDVPRLSSLYLSKIPSLGMGGDSTVPIPWSQLVSLKLDHVPSVGTVFHILQKSQDLTDCAIKVDSIFGPLSRDPIYHRRLISLTLNIDYEHASVFLQYVALPGLAQLTIYVGGSLEQYGWPHRKFIDFLERSECRLVHFEIHDTGMRFDEFAECVSAPQLQSLERIIVDEARDWRWDPYVTDLALEWLTCSTFLDKSSSSNSLTAIAKPMACILPKLESLTFRGSCLCSVDGAVADMIESRWRFHCNEVRRIKCVELDLLSNQVEDFRRLTEFCNEGLELDLSAR